MATKFVSRKTSRLYDAAEGGTWRMVLIFGDEVETTGPSSNGRVPARFRGRDGWIKQDHLGSMPALELYFIDVGQGDSTFIVTPSRKKILVDGGKNRRALGFLAWKYRLDQGVDPIEIDLLVVSHGDEDHLAGLAPIVSHPKIQVRRIVHNGIATFQTGAFQTTIGDRVDHAGSKYLVTHHDSPQELTRSQLSPVFQDWRDAVPENASCEAVDSTTGFLNVGEPAVRIEVLGPRRETLAANGMKAYRWFGDPADTINGHSVVLRLEYEDTSVLLPGDLNRQGARNLLEDPAITQKLAAHVFKAPHHGSHQYHRPLLDAIRPQISVISSGDDPDHGHPRAVFVGGVGLASRSGAPLVFSTEIAATFVEAGETVVEVGDSILESLNVHETGALAVARKLFKRRLHGMINVRTDGRDLYAARRVTAGYWWESYGPLHAAP
jgi:competence protein ComEC